MVGNCAVYFPMAVIMAEVEQKLGTTVKKCVLTCLLPVTHSQVTQRTIVSAFKIIKHKAILAITLQPTQRQTIYPSLAPIRCTVVPATVNVVVLRMLNSVTSLSGWSVHHSQCPMLFGHYKALLHPVPTTQALLKPSTDCPNNQRHSLLPFPHLLYLQPTGLER